MASKKQNKEKYSIEPILNALRHFLKHEAMGTANVVRILMTSRELIRKSKRETERLNRETEEIRRRIHTP